jgi:MoaA/NifB/PqqE/SkfB family radical SAM enzyme
LATPRYSLPLLQKSRPETIPVTDDAFALFRFGEQCNNDCPMCPNSGRPEGFFFPVDELLRRADFLAASGVRGVFVTGGEPTIHPGFWTLVDRLRGHGMRWHINTHGRRFSDEEFTARAAAAELGLAIVSFHSHEVAASCELFGVSEKGHWETVAGVEKILAAKIPLYLNCVITRLNAPHLADLVRWCIARFGRDYMLKFSFPLGFGKGAEWPGAHLKYSEIITPLNEARAVAEQEGVPLLFDGFPNCVLGDPLNMNRGRSGCGETLYLEDLAGKKIYSIKFLEGELTVFGPACVTCRAFARCPGVSKTYVNRFGFTEFPPL